jgi:hypothetical protein
MPIPPISPTPRITPRMPSMDKPINVQHRTWQRLFAKLKMQPGCCLQIDFQDGLPMEITPVRKDEKMKLA